MTEREPNMQCVVPRTAEVHALRHAARYETGWRKLADVDFAQVEMRVMAAMQEPGA